MSEFGAGSTQELVLSTAEFMECNVNVRLAVATILLRKGTKPHGF